MYNAYCSAPHCCSWAKRNPGLYFHRFPEAGKSKVYVETKIAGKRELVDRRNIWLRNLKILKPVSKHMSVCSLHFVPEDYVSKGKRVLKKNAVPTLNLPLHVEASAVPGPSKTGIMDQPSGNLQNMIKIEENLDQPTESNCSFKIETAQVEDVKFKLEELHHSIDIKDEPCSAEYYADEKSETEIFVPSIDETNENLKIHLKSHTGKIPIVCGICKLEFSHKGNLKVHSRIHTGEKSFKCKICDEVFTRKGQLKLHLFKHTGEKPFKCKICSCTFTRNSCLKVHLRGHTGDKPFECSFCEYKCATAYLLKVHSSVHTGEKPFQCNFCDHKSAQKAYLKLHLKIHTGLNMFQCNLCDYKCKHNYDLKKHLRIHTGEKPFGCNICQYRFARKDTLNQHLKTHTGEKM